MTALPYKPLRPAAAALACAALLTAVPAQAAYETSERASAPETAIVIGIQDYDHVTDLTNTRNDARAVAEMLRSFGYTVFEGYDLDKRGFEALLRQAALNIRDGSQVFFYYAGHGIQLGRRNYLLTSDAELSGIHDLPFQSVTLDRVSAILGGKAGSQILMLDSCRDNPVPDAKLSAEVGAQLYEAREGFDVFRPPLNTLVAFSTSPGATALDGEPGGNSPYTASVVRHFPDRPEEDAMTVLAAIRGDVYSTTGNTQVPWESSTLMRKIYLRPPDRSLNVAKAEPGAAPASLNQLPDQLSVKIPLGRSLELAPEIRPYVGAGTTVTLLESPSSGVTSLQSGDGSALSLSYAPKLAELPARQDGGQVRKDRMVLRLAQADTVRDVTVNLEMVARQCDLEAGDLLDLQGVGLYRYPNEIDLKAAEAACREAVQAAPELGRLHYQLGRALQGQGRLIEAYDAFEKAAELGHVRAYNAVAYLHVTPNVDRETVPIAYDPDKAFALWDKGIEAGDPFSMHARGKRLLRTSSTPEQKQRGFDLLSRAVELGHTYSMNELGVFFLWSGDELAQPERGLSYLEASAGRGDIYGTANLGYVYRDGGAGKPADKEKARALFAEAAQLGHPHAPAEIGRMIMGGDLPGRDAAEALEWYDMGLSRGDAWGGANGAWVALNRLSDRVPAHAAAARAGKAMALNDPDARAAARELLSGMPERDVAAGTQYILRQLGSGIAVDGQFGPASRKQLENRAREAGLPAIVPEDPVSRLQLAAQIHFALNPIRQDLF
ncbi:MULTISPECIES: caspase family protein [Leisingera]|jgi:TPR repeat protein|uniref:caspase family protein n=1 Tax=Leisingera TaxID=191028 RepID=UPI001150464F|nr:MULTISPECIES: caspase family protein [Leisingera]QDI75709.1 peptidase C14, caspase catalytic subunit p20 [Leisingera aquaemixtae]